MEKININIVQFYITHTCNIACPGCLSFNNFKISGHELWKDNEEFAKQWASVITPKDFTVIGGEPLSNPDIDNWIVGLRQYFSDIEDFKICTNGLLISSFKEKIRKWWDLGVILEISAHTENQYKKIVKDLKNILDNDNIEKYNPNKHKNLNIPDYYNEDYNVILLRDNKPIVLIAEEFQFYKWGARKISKDTVHLYNSNPREAHKNCEIYDCHYIYRGELYKCGTMVGAKELLNKYNLDDRSKKLITDYKPISLSDDNLREKIEKLTDNHIPQCSLCPSSLIDQEREILDSDIKKVTYQK